MVSQPYTMKGIIPRKMQIICDFSDNVIFDEEWGVADLLRDFLEIPSAITEARSAWTKFTLFLSVFIFHSLQKRCAEHMKIQVPDDQFQPFQKAMETISSKINLKHRA